jgi:hypothetical protein
VESDVMMAHPLDDTPLWAPDAVRLCLAEAKQLLTKGLFRIVSMVNLGHIYGDSGDPGNSKLAHYVRERLPEGYMVNDRDLRWLDVCDGFVTGSLSNESVTDSVKAAFAAHPKGHIDPFELLIDAKICDTNCQPLP